MSKNSKNLGFRGWFYFRQGWSNYFAFIFAAINTLTVTYYLAIEKYPSLELIFPNFLQYVLIISSIGIPLLTFVGYVHWKKSAARKAEVDIFYEVNPYLLRALVNTELILKMNLTLNDKILKLSEKKFLSSEDYDDIQNLQKEFSKFVNERKFDNKDDLKYFKNTEAKNN